MLLRMKGITRLMIFLINNYIMSKNAVDNIDKVIDVFYAYVRNYKRMKF